MVFHPFLYFGIYPYFFAILSSRIFHLRAWVMSSRLVSFRDAQLSPDLSRLKALGQPEGELPFDVRILSSTLKPTDG